MRTTADHGDDEVAGTTLEDQFFEVSIDLLVVLDFSGFFKRLSSSWERTLGFTRAELMSRPFIDLVHPDDRARTLEQNAAVRRGGSALGFENRYACKDGSYRWLRWNAAPIVVGRTIYGVARDVTELKAAEAERERLLEELTQALAEVKALQAILPICSYCRKVRDDKNYWQSVEEYVAKHIGSQFSHSICPSCMETHVEPQLR
jgi:PAS domain S-box-containing protein